MNEQFDIKKVKVYRTLEGTIFEAAALIILLSGYYRRLDWYGRFFHCHHRLFAMCLLAEPYQPF